MQEGQVGLIVLLIMVVVTTVAVSVSTRSVSELRISRQEQESTRSLNLAESGLEDLLKDDLSAVYTTDPTGTRQVDGKDVKYQIAPQYTVNNLLLLQGHTFEVDVNGATAVGLSWTPADCTGAAEVAIITTTGLRRYVYHRSGCSQPANSTDLPASITINATDRIMRIKALMRSLSLNVTRSGATTNPLYHQVTTSSTLEDGTTRAVQVNKFPGSLPSLFDYVLFSGTQLTK